jgi:hypothetical protein
MRQTLVGGGFNFGLSMMVLPQEFMLRRIHGPCRCAQNARDPVKTSLARGDLRGVAATAADPAASTPPARRSRPPQWANRDGFLCDGLTPGSSTPVAGQGAGTDMPRRRPRVRAWTVARPPCRFGSARLDVREQRGLGCGFMFVFEGDTWSRLLRPMARWR